MTVVAYTDQIPVNQKVGRWWKTNQELSAMRAVNTQKFFLQNGFTANEIFITGMGIKKLQIKCLPIFLDYSASLRIEDLSNFMAILPLDLQNKIWKILPDLKADKVRSKELKINEKSYEMKHNFLQQIKSIN